MNNNEIRLVKKEPPESQNPQKSPPEKRPQLISAKSPIIQKMHAQEKEQSKNRLSDEELIELEFWEEAERIRAQRRAKMGAQTLPKDSPNATVIKTSIAEEQSFDYLNGLEPFTPSAPLNSAKSSESVAVKSAEFARESFAPAPAESAPFEPSPGESTPRESIFISESPAASQDSPRGFAAANLAPHAASALNPTQMPPSPTLQRVPLHSPKSAEFANESTRESAPPSRAPLLREESPREPILPPTPRVVAPMQTPRKMEALRAQSNISISNTPAPNATQLNEHLREKIAQMKAAAQRLNSDAPEIRIHKSIPPAHNDDLARQAAQSAIESANIALRHSIAATQDSPRVLTQDSRQISIQDSPKDSPRISIQDSPRDSHPAPQFTPPQTQTTPSAQHFQPTPQPQPEFSAVETAHAVESSAPESYAAQIPPQNAPYSAVESGESALAQPHESAQNPAQSAPGVFTLPHTGLLNPPTPQNIDIDEAENDIKANNLMAKLRVFRINGDITDIYSGPVVTTFEFRPAPDVKVSRIHGFQDDLSMALKAKSIRIQAPIPGKDVVGIEVPNSVIATIYIREIFESAAFVDSRANLAIALGKDIIGRPVVEDLAKLPHLLIAGTTGSGKSVGLNGMILSLLYKNAPSELRFIMIDPKKVELSLYKDIPHLLTPIITDSKKAVTALGKAVDEMNRRYEVMNDAGVKNITGYNEIAEEKMPYIVIIIDEFADLMITGGKDAEGFLISLASKARACGMHLIIATQRPTTNVVTGLIKSNLPAKISYRVGSQIDSKVILDKNGAESLLGNGDLLFSYANATARLHAAFTSEKEIERVANYIRAQMPPIYDDFFEPKDSAQIATTAAPKTDEEFLIKAKEIMRSTNKTSISHLQRALGVGFNKAANIVESLEKEGFLSAANSKGIREIIGD